MTLQPRLVTGVEAAAYLGLSRASFAKWVADGRAPKPLPGTRRWDRKAIDLALDEISGIPPAVAQVVSPFDQRAAEEAAEDKWLRDYDARKAAERPDMRSQRSGTVGYP